MFQSRSTVRSNKIASTELGLRLNGLEAATLLEDDDAMPSQLLVSLLFT